MDAARTTIKHKDHGACSIANKEENILCLNLLMFTKMQDFTSRSEPINASLTFYTRLLKPLTL
ncbi:hypothetical protein R6Q59_000108 [Mikania micrantha]